MASRFPRQRDIGPIARRSIDAIRLSKWRRRLATVATTLAELLQVRPIPVPVRVTATRGRHSHRR